MAVKSKYAVVEFIKEESVAVVLRSWIDRDEEGLFCYWPNTSYSIRVKRGELPDKDKWKTYRIRIFGYAETYELAIFKANKAVETSHLESMEETECTGIQEDRNRTSKKPKRFISSTDDEDEDCRTPRKSPRLLVKSKGKGRDISLPKPPNFSGPRENRLSGIKSPNVQPERVTNTSRLTDIIPIPSDHDELEVRLQQPRPYRYKTNENFQTKVLMKLEEIIEHQKTIIDILRQIQNQQVTDTNNPIPFEHLESPMDDEKELQDFNDKLRSEPDFRNQMIKFMQGIGGHNCGDGVCRIMSKIGTTKLWSMFSLKGKRKKKCFHNLPLCKIITATCRNVYKANEKEVEKELAEMLKHCPDKQGGPRYKKPSTNEGGMLDA